MSYSYSSIKVYEECPFKYKLTRIDRKQEPSGDAAERGKRIHAEFESAIKDLALITPEMEHWTDKLTELREAEALCEYQFGIDDKWQPCSFTDPMSGLEVSLTLQLSMATRRISLIGRQVKNVTMVTSLKFTLPLC